MCLSFGWLLQIIVWLIVCGALVAIYRIWVAPLLGALDGRIVATINILIWLLVALFVIFYVIVPLLSCLIVVPRVR